MRVYVPSCGIVYGLILGPTTAPLMEPIQVYVRLRPDDTNQASDCCVQCDTTDNTITIFNNSSLHNGLYSTKENQQNGFSFQFDKVFPANASQEDVFDHVVHTIKECFKGFDVTVFAYGTTGSGNDTSIILCDCILTYASSCVIQEKRTR